LHGHLGKLPEVVRVVPLYDALVIFAVSLQDRIPYATAQVNQADLPKAFNGVAGVTMTADVTNAIKKLDKAYEKAGKRKGNGLIDALNQ